MINIFPHCGCNCDICIAPPSGRQRAHHKTLISMYPGHCLYLQFMQQMNLPLSEVENNVFISYTAVCLPKNKQKSKIMCSKCPSVVQTQAHRRLCHSLIAPRKTVFCSMHTVLQPVTTDFTDRSRVVSVLDSGAVGPGFKSQSRRCRVTVSGKLSHSSCLCSPSSGALVAALLRIARVTASLAESNGSLPPSL